jgi:hypothetical protein
VHHVDLAHAAFLAGGFDEAAQVFAAAFGSLDMADDERAAAGGFVA